MIDLLKNYNDLKTAPGYKSSIRYYLAKKKLDTLFVKWLSSNKELAEQLLKKAQSGKLNASEHPNALFTHHRVPLQSSNIGISQIQMNNTITPPRFNQENGCNEFNMQKMTGEEFLMKLMEYIITKSLKEELSATQIPQFYFPNGKPIDNVSEQSYRSSLNAIIGDKNEISHEVLKNLVVDIIGLPNYFSILVLKKASKSANPEKISKAEFNILWKELEDKQISKRAFWLLTSGGKYATIDDFKRLFKQILNVHPGLDFLKQTPDFQDWYSLCVIHRMFYMANRKYDYKMTYREFKKSNILKSFFDIESEPQINKNADFFSYEDFYVIYIKFWELDVDHDFFLTKEELSKYSGYTLSRKTIERIFSQNVKRFQQPDKMGFGDFVWFIVCVEDKTTEQSIQYWFKIMDLDGNGIVTGYELQYFYEEQNQRLAYMDSTLDFNFQNIVCQMVDLFKPQKDIQFTFDDFLKRKSDCSVFINMLTDLNKLVGFEQRDAYEERTVKVDNPTWTDWDRFAKTQYKRIENSPENDEGGEVLNWQNDD